VSTTNEYPIEPGQSWEVDFFRPEDAESVTRLFLSVYGESYPIKTFIQPEVLIRENEAGRTISSVARTPKGDIVGHTALFSSAPYGEIRESGAGLVHSSYRAGGINRKIIEHSYEVAATRAGVVTAFGEAVCNHIFMQKIVYGLRFEYHALEVDLMPASAYETEKSAAGRVAAITAFRTYRPKPHRVFVPAAYEEALGYLYSGLDDRREIFKSGEQPPANSLTRVEVSYFEFAQVARLAVWEPGADFASVLEREETKVLQKGAVVIQASVNLGFPWTGDAVETLRRRGYFLSGLLPRWFDQDAILMQKITKRPDWEGIHLLSDRSKRIRDLVEEDWRRAEESKQ
jgi:hypothetical protein